MSWRVHVLGVAQVLAVPQVLYFSQQAPHGAEVKKDFHSTHLGVACGGTHSSFLVKVQSGAFS